ncbi:transketolase family protein [Roseinatronobacter alkalisoli]|uniref:Transketolase C-terminal domain-containing protein n=1 Tax=Roseinatronobacter alkalisoli TaxID=3028235 RepID=A0ABT5THH6_9RHOB|nr:transketolase C-terminal domain-containing protein [Roseinatronobacter sp. HJB301]MDD7973383.1 transketolase C-terminal domain-containing protein [Roseinatronobacter sp. HJB301]
MEMVNRPYASAFEAYAVQHPEVLCLSADLTSSCEIDGFRDRHPDQFLSLGMAEQNMLSFAGGLGLAGFRPFIHSFGVFLYRRPYDQLMASIAYPRRKVRLMGFLPGITTPGGMTHQAIEDISVMRTIPNMTVLEAGDATEVESIVAEADTVDGPVYCRILRGSVPRLFNTPLRIGQMRVLAEGDDVLVVTAGIATEEAMRARAALDAAGVAVRHLHLSTLKPFDAAQIVEHAASVRHGVVTLENHLVAGGVGSMVAEALAEAGLARKLVRLGLQDTYAHGGSKPYLMRYYGLDALSLVRAVERVTGQETGITEEALCAVRVDAVHSAVKAEAL